MTTTNQVWEVTGSGPAGYTAALYTARASFSPSSAKAPSPLAAH